MNRRTKLSLSGITAFAFIGLWHCSTTASFFFSPEDEQELGDQFDQEIRGQEKFVSADAPISKYIDSLGRSIAAKIPDDEWEHLLPAGKTKENFFSFSVIESNVENAFAVPGGYTYFYTAILEKMTTEAELIGVMGHEIGHVVKHHSRNRMMKAGAIQTVLAIVTGENDGSVMDAIPGLGANWWLANDGQGDELESDSIGVHISNRLKINPKGIAKYFSKGLEFDSNGNCAGESNILVDIAESMSTHPPSCDRVNQVEEFCKSGSVDCNLTGGTSTSEYKTKVLDRM